MKLNRYKSFVFLAAGLLLFAGCKKEKFEINSNPDSVTEGSVTPSVLLPGALQNTARIVATDWTFLNMWMGYWARNGSFQSLTDIETYRFDNDFQVQIWNDLYANNNVYNLMTTRAKASGAGTYEAIGRIMKAHNFGILVDVYGNVPYFEAFQGTATPTPKYDKAEDIYKELFKELDAAIALLKNTTATGMDVNPDIATADLAFGGNTTRWIQFANTLRLRLLVHLHNGITNNQVAAGFNISGEAAKITSEGFLGRGQSATINPGFVATKPNPYYRAYVQNESGIQAGDFIRAGEFAVEYYKYNGDPRVTRFYTAVGGQYVGNRFGRPSDATGQYTGDKLSTVRGPGLLPNGASSRAWILTSMESLLLQAEARHRGVLTSGPTAKVLLNTAIQESFTFLGLTDAQANTYIANNATYPDVDYDYPGGANGPAGGLYTILVQKYFALNAIATFEVWTDYRRTDYVLGSPVGLPLTGPPISIDPGNTSTRIPRRLLYPQNEYNYNASNVGAQGTVNVFNNKIFWDLN